jgi:hypothetical protein
MAFAQVSTVVEVSERTVDALPESELLVAARRGDPAAFERLVSRHRRELYAHCYQMLGSVQAAAVLGGERLESP